MESKELLFDEFHIFFSMLSSHASRAPAPLGASRPGGDQHRNDTTSLHPVLISQFSADETGAAF
jgi:hypothetical protein